VQKAKNHKMKVQTLYSLQERLEIISTTTKNLSLDMAKIRIMKYGIESQSLMFDKEISITKSQIKTNIETIIVELHNIKDQVV